MPRQWVTGGAENGQRARKSGNWRVDDGGFIWGARSWAGRERETQRGPLSVRGASVAGLRGVAVAGREAVCDWTTEH